MANSTPVTANVDTASAAQYNNLRLDVLDLTSGHLHDGTNGRAPGDNAKTYFGTGLDASIYYDGTNLIIDPAEVGTGGVVVNGARKVYINDSANANMTAGLTINQGASDDEILALKSSDVAHGMTTLTETDSFALLKKEDATGGGLRIQGFTDGGESILTALKIKGVLGQAANTTKTAAGGQGVIELEARIKSGTSETFLGADGNMVVIRHAGNAARFIFDAEGSGHADVEWTTYDAYDDLALLSDMESELLARESPGQTERRRLLEEAGIIGRDSWHLEEGRPRAMVNFTRLAMLHHGALRQVGARLMALEDENQRLRELIQGALPCPE